jgi:hypothetical protein
VQVPNFPQGWVAMSDGSIHAARGRRGCEFVSPILRGADGLRQIIDVCEKLHAMGASVNRTTGLHVHVGFDRSNNAGLERLIHLTANFEKAIYASTGTKARENNRYCGGIRGYGEAQRVMGSYDRYHVLNVSGLLTGGKPTVEFRAFAGTLNAEKIIGYVRMCLGLVQRAVEAERKATWVGKEPAPGSPQRRGGEGQTQLTRLFYQLGWTKGRMKKTYGDLNAEGLPPIAKTKRTLMGLARKYDARS